MGAAGDNSETTQRYSKQDWGFGEEEAAMQKILFQIFLAINKALINDLINPWIGYGQDRLYLPEQ